uniref:BTB domain-containing protein n=1 Tax=Caenorhabditis tropicalis TaxID=1561998 RepID=A0A1I7SXG2_9PELO
MDLSDMSSSQLATSPPPRTAIDYNSSFEESPAKRVKYSHELTKSFDEKLSQTVILVLRNNEEVVVVRSLLSSYSTYFRVLFSSDFRDSKSSSHRIRLVSAPDLHLLLTIPRAFEQGIKPNINIQRAVEILEPAAFLQMSIALDYITDVISENVSHENIIKIFRLALLYYTPLALRVWRTMIRQFQTMFNTNVYLTLKENELIGLLTDKHLNLKSEDERKVITNWIDHNSHLQTDRIVQFAQRNFSRRPQPDSTQYEVIRNRQPMTAIVSFGGWANRGVAQKIEVFNTRCDRWQTCSFNYDVPNIRRAYHGIDIVDDKLIVFGGFNGFQHFQTTVLFDLATKEWKNGTNMHDKRCYVTATKVKDSHGRQLIYACGGMNGISRLKSAEMYDYQQDLWTEIANMSHLRSDGAVITIDNKVVAIGGFDGRHVHLGGESYDPIVDQWHPLSSNMRTRRTGCTAVSIMNNVCMVIGGFNGIKRLDTAEIYDMREGLWHPVSVMHTARSNFSACPMDYSIYVAGGFDGQSTTKETERLDLRNRKWQALPDMAEAKSALRIVTLSDHSFLDELFNVPEDDGVVTTW